MGEDDLQPLDHDGAAHRIGHGRQRRPQPLGGMFAHPWARMHQERTEAGIQVPIATPQHVAPERDQALEVGIGPGPGRRQDQPIDPLRVVERDGLGDRASEGMAYDMRTLDPQSVTEMKYVITHLG